ncbi:hypothetical protein CY652_07215 [Burkholderia sp. WAC0059]|uniref:hypothetical protein n=1 Tax=Burkholderia sp. WAC0059 TaxID=2066022 RepID=UPI000C7F3D55|nr:hypothetical protein [Burkholderia sp. WAC0059]PLZ03091.1 hypothetical protein CY652_07215 [Burkholderia sp. WAC0059]
MIDYQQEFASFLEFVAEVAVHIRNNTPAYDASAEHRPHASEDIRWLAEALHNFEVLGAAIAAGDAREIVFVCAGYIHTYEGFRTPPAGDAAAKAGHDAFARNGGVELLEHGLGLLKSIRQKAHTAIEENPGATQHGAPVMVRRSHGHG